MEYPSVAGVSTCCLQPVASSQIKEQWPTGNVCGLEFVAEFKCEFPSAPVKVNPTLDQQQRQKGDQKARRLSMLAGLLGQRFQATCRFPCRFLRASTSGSAGIGWSVWISECENVNICESQANIYKHAYDSHLFRITNCFFCSFGQLVWYNNKINK